MVTEKDIINMGRKIKRSKNPKTLAKYQIQIDAWIAELEEAQAQTQADILTLEAKIKLEEEARAAEYAGRPKKEVPLPGIGRSEVSVQGREPEKTPVALPGIATVDKKVPASAPESPPGETTKKVAGPRKCYHYFEFERLHLRRSRF